MSISRRLRNIAMSQISAIQDRLNRIDAEAVMEAERKIEQRRIERDAREELDDPTAIYPVLRSPQDIAAGVVRSPGDRPANAAGRPGGYSGRTEVSASRSTGPISEQAATTAYPASSAASPAASVSPVSLHLHYKVLGLEDGADFSAVQSTYNKLAVRCDPSRFPEGSEDRKMAESIRSRVDVAYDALRDALDSTAGRFDKLELE